MRERNDTIRRAKPEAMAPLDSHFHPVNSFSFMNCVRPSAVNINKPAAQARNSAWDALVPQAAERAP